MGYTHYFTQRRDLTPAEWEDLNSAVRSIAEAAKAKGVSLWRPNLSLDVLTLNGVGDLAHETFILRRRGQGFAFCKTAQKPYDVVVTAILASLPAIAPGAFKVSSDGDLQDWAPGIALAHEAGCSAAIYPCS